MPSQNLGAFPGGVGVVGLCVTIGSMAIIKPSAATELLGWYGMLALIGAYFMVSFGFIVAEGLAFQVLNLTGGVALVVFAVSKKATQLAILNIFWALIGVVAVVRIFL